MSEKVIIKEGEEEEEIIEEEDSGFVAVRNDHIVIPYITETPNEDSDEEYDKWRKEGYPIYTREAVQNALAIVSKNIVNGMKLNVSISSLNGLCVHDKKQEETSTTDVDLTSNDFL